MHGIGSSRFFPLAGVDLTLLEHISANPYLFYAFNTLEFLVTAFVLFQVSVHLGITKYAPFLMIAFVNASYVLVITSICYPERLLCMGLALFLLFFMQYLKAPSFTNFALTLLFANMALYLKEPVFILIGGIGVGVLLSSFYDVRRRYLGASLLGFALLFLVIFFTLRSSNIIEGALTIKHIALKYANLSLDAAPISLLLLAIILIRIFICLKERTLPRLYDYILGSILVYELSYTIITTGSLYYYAPVYIIGLPFIIYFVAGLLGDIKASFAPLASVFKRAIFSAFVAFTLALYLLQGVAGFVRVYGVCKLYPVAYYKMIDFMKSKELAGKSIAYYGLLDKGHNNIDTFFSYMALQNFLGNGFKILKYKNIDADYLILSYKTFKFITPADFAKISRHYDLVYKSGLSSLPNYGLKAWGKYLYYRYKYGKDSAIQEALYRQNISGQIFNKPLYIYVFKKRY